MAEHQKLLVINQYYAPDIASTGQYAADICSGLVKRGFEVYVIAGQPSYVASSPMAPEYELLNGVHVYRIYLGKNHGRKKMKTRILGYLRFLYGAWRLAENLVKSIQFQSVLTFHNPPFVGVVGAYLSKKYRLRFIYIPYDIHPDILLATGWKLSRPAVLMWEFINKVIFRQAKAIIVLGEGMKNNLVNHKKVPPQKVRIIPIWGNPEFEVPPKIISSPKDISLNEKELLFLYAGNMGNLHNLCPILDAANLVRHLPVRFLFVGDGVKRQHLLSRVKNEKLHHITVLPYQPEEQFTQILASSHACFVVLGFGLEKFAVPSRAYTFLSAGKPLITLMAPNADISTLVAEAGCGWNVLNGKQLAELTNWLVDNPQELIQRGKIARALYENRFNRECLIQEYAEVLNNAELTGSSLYS